MDEVTIKRLEVMAESENTPPLLSKLIYTFLGVSASGREKELGELIDVYALNEIKLLKENR